MLGFTTLDLPRKVKFSNIKTRVLIWDTDYQGQHSSREMILTFAIFAIKVYGDGIQGREFITLRLMLLSGLGVMAILTQYSSHNEAT